MKNSMIQCYDVMYFSVPFATASHKMEFFVNVLNSVPCARYASCILKSKKKKCVTLAKLKGESAQNRKIYNNLSWETYYE